VLGTREWYPEIGSTQDRALALARAGAEEGTRVVARTQTSGRGRADHVWESPPGGLYLSVVLASPTPDSLLLPLGIGSELAGALGRRCATDLAVKWPNDILVAHGPLRGRKLAGVLLDRVASPRLGHAAIAGIGVNVRTDRNALPSGVRDGVGTLAELVVPPPEVDEVEELVVAAALQAARRVRDATARTLLREECRRKLWGVGRRAVLDGRPVGTIVALGDEGELWVESAGERMAIRTGDLRVEEAP
jgi:BirA family transcriptional regulator, biotin operon repressor / biotin---[acetyl-CoA-carboxylase] ligase